MKRTIRIRFLVAGLLAATAFTAGAQSAGVSVAVDATPDATTAERGDRVDPNCLRHTGSRITASRTAARKQKQCAPAFGRVWTREDLDRTGRVDLADALRALDPSIR